MPKRYLSRRSALRTISAGVFVTGFSGLATARGHGNVKRDLAELRSVTAKYNDPANAYADGYTAVDHHGAPVALADVTDDAEAVCNMGYHFLNLGLIMDEKATMLQPEVLVYGEDDDENLLLGAVEYIIPTSKVSDAKEWFAGDDDEWEKFDEVPLPFDASAMHVWVHSHNPDGVFNPTNPRKQFSPEGCSHH